MIRLLRELALDESGTALVEYALIVSLVSMVSWLTLLAIGSALQTFFGSASNGLAGIAQNPS